MKSKCKIPTNERFKREGALEQKTEHINGQETVSEAYNNTQMNK